MTKYMKKTTFVLFLSLVSLTSSAIISLTSTSQGDSLAANDVSTFASLAGIDTTANGTDFDSNALELLSENINQILQKLNTVAPPPAAQAQTTSSSEASSDTTPQASQTPSSENPDSPKLNSPRPDVLSPPEKQRNFEDQESLGEVASNYFSFEESSQNETGLPEDAGSNSTSFQQETSQQKSSTASEIPNLKRFSTETTDAIPAPTTTSSTEEFTASSSQVDSQTVSNLAVSPPAEAASLLESQSKPAGLCSSDEDCTLAYGSFIAAGLRLTCNQNGVCAAV